MRTLLLLVALSACSGPSTTAPETTPSLPDTSLIKHEATVVDKGEIILRSAGAEMGRETFEVERAGDRLQVLVEVDITQAPYQSIALQMRVDEATWAVDGFDLEVNACKAHLRTQGAMMELAAEYPDGEHVVVDREGREHAGHFVTMRPTMTQTAICAVADDAPHALDSYPPWYVVRTAPRAATEHPTADGKGRLDKVVVDELIDVYCDGARLAIVHYPAHAFIAARSEYDALAQQLTAPDPIDELWTGELGCPSPPEPEAE